MIHIIKYEVYKKIQSFHFILLLVTSICLFSLNSVLFIQQFDEESAYYSEKTVSPYPRPSTISTELYSRPSPLSFIVQDGNKKQTSGYTLKPTGIVEPLPSANTNYKFPDIPDVDWLFIIEILFSLYTLIFGYNMISGEKESGTLSLIVSNPITRVKVFFAKYLSIMIIVLIPLTCGILINLTIISMYRHAMLTFNSVLTILVIYGISIVYISLFALLCLLFSSLLHQSSLVILVLFFIWLFFYSYPSISKILVEEFYDLPDEHQISKQIGPLLNDLLTKKIEQIRKRVRMHEFESDNDVKNELQTYMDETQNQFNSLQTTYYNSIRQRSNLIHTMSLFSPMVQFQSVLDAMAQTGFIAENIFVSDIEKYSKNYDDYIRKKTGKLIGPWRLHRITYNFLLTKEPIDVSTPYPEEYTGDKSDFPVFSHSEMTVSKSIGMSMNYLAGLMLWNMVLLLTSIYAFIRYDVR
jgi:ABC-type transport system involved in multi-copper enzyme maturation permease subunit